MKRKIYKDHLFYSTPQFSFFIDEVISNVMGSLSMSPREEQASFNWVKLYSEEA